MVGNPTFPGRSTGLFDVMSLIHLIFRLAGSFVGSCGRRFNPDRWL
jgi:hypothetical protein